MDFKQDWEICVTLGDEHCKNCGEYGKQPCDMKIPSHILNSQIPRFIRIAEKRNAKIL